MEWTEELKQLCFERQIRCMDTDYCMMREPCTIVLAIYRKKAGVV